MPFSAGAETGAQVRIQVFGPENNPEYHAAEQFKGLIESALLPSEEGQVAIHSSVKLIGQKRRDVDLFLIARFPRGLRRDIRLPNHSLPEAILFFNVVVAIEVKDQSSSGVDFRGTDAWVLYRDGWSCATKQSEEQKTAAFTYFGNLFGWSPFVCNLLWFRNLTKAELPTLPHLYLASDSTFEDFLEKLCLAAAPQSPYFHNNRSPKWHFYSTKVNNAAELLSREQSLFSLFGDRNQHIGALTRGKLEKVTREKLLKNQVYAQSIGKQLVLIRGRAGTGKTIKLLHIAYDLCVHQGKRVLILTYNRMLVSDLQRMVALAGVSSDFDDATVEIETVHRYVRRLLEYFEVPFAPRDFLDNYDSLKGALLGRLASDVIDKHSMTDFKRQKRGETNWDFVLIDEGQDWPEDERQILFQLFESSNFVVASGTGQSARSLHLANWTAGIEYNRPPAEKRSLRQKRNLCEFERLYAESFGIQWDLEPSEELTGGRLIIVKGEYDPALHERLFSQCKADGNSAYEYMFLAPPSLTEVVDGEKQFSLATRFEEWGISIWDGVNRRNRTEYPTQVNEHRVVTYESARGLEGWTVVCLHLDEFVQYKFDNPYILDDEFVDSGKQMSLSLKSREERLQELVHQWVLIALTRAIDTTVISLRDPSSAFSRELIRIALKCPDFVEIIDAQSGWLRKTRIIPHLQQTKVESQPLMRSEGQNTLQALPRRIESEAVSLRATSCDTDADSPIQVEQAQVNQVGSSPHTAPDVLLPFWVVKEFFAILANSDERGFLVQVTHSHVVFRSKRSPSGPAEWRDVISTLLRYGLIIVVEKGHNVGGKEVQGKDYPRNGEYFRYKITDAGSAQASRWLKEAKEGTLKNGMSVRLSL